MPQRNRPQRLSGAGNVPGDLTSVHECVAYLTPTRGTYDTLITRRGIPIRRHDASNNSSTAGKQATSTFFVAQNSPRDIQSTYVAYNYTLAVALYLRSMGWQPVTNGYAGVAVCVA
jgi:hypothetical protein